MTQIYDSSEKRSSVRKTLQSFWTYRELVVVLVKRDLTVRYKRSLLGVTWTLVNPLLTSLVLWVVFVQIFAQRFANGTSSAPYVLSGVLILVFFQQGFNQAADAIAQSASILMKIYVPPQIFALAGAISNAINFMFGLIALTILSLITGDGISWHAPLVIPMAIFMLFYITGLGLMISIIYIKFQDSRNIVSVYLMLMTYLTPVFYPKEILSGPILVFAEANPLTSYADIFRDVFTNTSIATFGDWIFVSVSSIFFLVIGMRVFVRAWPRVVVMM